MLILAIALVVFATLIGAVGALLLKKGAVRFKLKQLFKSYTLILGLFLYILASVFFIYALRFAELNFLYPITSLSYVWVCLFSIKYLKERMNMVKWSGIIAIIIGVSLIGLGV